jgi:hypothetical protein
MKMIGILVPSDLGWISYERQDRGSYQFLSFSSPNPENDAVSFA